MKGFEEIIGHKPQIKELKNAIESNSLPHAYLFSGPSNIGKTSISKELAYILQCNKNNCKTCATCIQIKKNGHTDTYIDESKNSFKINQIKQLQSIESKTSTSNFKIFIIKDIERMTIPAANSFLKTLEEPNKKTLFILTTSHPNKILQTIISRTRQIKFQIPSQQEILLKIEKNFPEKTKSEILTLMNNTNKTPGEIINILKNTETELKFQNLYSKFKIIINNSSISEKFKVIEELTKSKDDKEKDLHKADIKLLLKLLLIFYRKKLKEDNKNIEKNINALLKITQTGILLKQNVNTKITLENLMLEI